MINKDYIMRMIQQLTVVLAKVLLKKENNNLNEANFLLDAAFEDIIGLDYNFIKGISSENILSLMNIDGGKPISAGKIIITAKLLFEKAKIENDIKDNRDYLNNCQKSLFLYLEGFTKGENNDDFIDFIKDVDELAKNFSYEELPDEINYKLFKFYDQYSMYNEAENILFYLKSINFTDIIGEGELFYKNLENLSDEELKLNNFSREEIKTGFKDLLK